MQSPEERTLKNSYDIEHIVEKIREIEDKIDELEKSDREHERDIGRWRTGLLVMAALGGIVTWVLNTLNNLKGFVK